jgi:diguanylate cyclase (GGDEF)-like protein
MAMDRPIQELMQDDARMRSRVRRGLWVTSTDFYAEADLDAAKRIGGALWLIGAAIALLLLPIAPPTREAIGAFGWVVFAASISVCALSGVLLLKRPGLVSPNQLLFCSYSAIVVIAAMRWLGGPAYSELFLLSIIYTASTHPPRRVIPYLFVMAAGAAAPLLYESASRAAVGDIAGRVLIWWGLAAVTMFFVARVRTQRTGLREAGVEASRLARVDALTGLGNRRAFDEALAASIARARRSELQLTLIVADLDGFKLINDRFGHIAGDACLKAVANALRRSIRAPEACFRWGGDEFSIIVDGDRAAAEALSERLGEVVSSECEDPEGNAVTMRFGSASLVPGSEPNDLVNAADLDLMAAKAS